MIILPLNRREHNTFLSLFCWQFRLRLSIALCKALIFVVEAQPRFIFLKHGWFSNLDILHAIFEVLCACLNLLIWNIVIGLIVPWVLNCWILLSRWDLLEIRGPTFLFLTKYLRFKVTNYKIVIIILACPTCRWFQRSWTLIDLLKSIPFWILLAR